jgi:hypothetical protein
VRKLLAAAALVGGLVACPPAQATLLTPGAPAVSPVDQVGVGGFTGPSGPQVGADVTVTGSVPGDIQVSITSQVFKDSSSSNLLDFVYTVTNSGDPMNFPNDFTSVSFKSFAGYATDVGYYGDAGLVGVGRANRTNTGQSVVFDNFLTSTGKLELGQSFKVVIKTDATTFSTGESVVRNDTSLTITPTYAPAPEPNAVLLFATGCVGFGGLLVWRRKARLPPG